MTKILYFITEDWYFCSHRMSLAKQAIKTGYEVVLLTNVKLHGCLIRSEGIRIIPLGLLRRSMNPFLELKTIFKIVRVYMRERPDLVHHVAMKPVLYGSIAAFFSRIPRVVNAFAGMGSLFISESFKARLLRECINRLLKIFLKGKQCCFILQNPDDAGMVIKSGVAGKDQISLIRGSGVDTTQFSPTVEPEEPIVVMLPSRMLYDKGVEEFVGAAKLLGKRGVNAYFILAGMCDSENPSSIPEEQLQCWQQEKNIKWLGHQSDMPGLFAQSHIVCLPSYREGLPKSLLEAASCGRPIVATDVPGCREIVKHNENGFLVPPRDSIALADAILFLINNSEVRIKMGKRGREIVLNEFSEEIVTMQTMDIYKNLINS